MKTKHYQDKYVQCPFYHQEKTNTMMCEGVNDESSIQITFATADNKKDYKQECCCGKWRECRVAKMLLGKY